MMLPGYIYWLQWLLSLSDGYRQLTLLYWYWLCDTDDTDDQCSQMPVQCSVWPWSCIRSVSILISWHLRELTRSLLLYQHASGAYLSIQALGLLSRPPTQTTNLWRLEICFHDWCKFEVITFDMQELFPPSVSSSFDFLNSWCSSLDPNY